MLQLPESFLEEMRELLGGEYDAWEKSYEGNEGFRGLRVNTGKLRPEEFQALSAFSLRPVPWTGTAFTWRDRSRLRSIRTTRRAFIISRSPAP